MADIQFDEDILLSLGDVQFLAISLPARNELKFLIRIIYLLAGAIQTKPFVSEIVSA